MGTPGDKKDLERLGLSSLTTTISSDSDSEVELPLLGPAEISSVLQLTAGASSEDMGVITHLPVPFSSASLPPLSNKPEIFQQQTLEQATLEDYYGQSKYYETLYPVAQQQSTATFQNISEPGPSGLQTPKSKSTPLPQLKKKKLDQKKNHVCPHCHKTFSTGQKLHRHYRSHQEAKETSPFKCDQCKKSFTSKFKLVRHALIHSDKKPFSCSVCDRTFHRKDHLKNHIKIHSPMKKLYECESCKKQYTSLLSFRKHQAVHAAEEGNLTCQICSEVFENKGQILYHLKVHAGSRTIKNPNEKKYLCDYCERRFFTKKDVKRHLVVHTGMRDFLCQFCPQRFGRKDHLVRHIKKSHNKDYTEQSVSQGSESSSQSQPHPAHKPETITSGALAILTPIFKEDSNDDLFEEIPSQIREVKEEPQELKSELDLEGVKTIFEEENVSPLEEEDIYRSEQSTQSELKELLVTDIFKKIGKPPMQNTSSEPKPSTTIKHLPEIPLATARRRPEEHTLSERLRYQEPTQASHLLSQTLRLQYSEPSSSVSQRTESPSAARIGVSELLVSPAVSTSSRDRPASFQQPLSMRRRSEEPLLPTLVPFHDALPLPNLKARPVLIQEPLLPKLEAKPLPDPFLPLPPLRIRPRTVPAAVERPQRQEEEEEMKPLPGFSQTFQPPPPS